MMAYEKSNEFRYFREISVIWLARNSKFPLQQILQKKLADFEELNKFFTNDLLVTYKTLRNELTTNEQWLFPTDEGKLFMPSKFYQNIQRMLEKANMPTKPNHPKKMSVAQVEALLGLRLSYERPVNQLVLAGALLGLQAMRPEEVAKLLKSDIDLDGRLILLRETKSQVNQFVPIHPDIADPLANFISHLKPGEPLFIRSTGQQWNRKDVHQAVEKIAEECGLEGINPRRLRTTVSHEMMSEGIQLNAISLVLRHSDESTTARHYSRIKDVEDARKAIERFRPLGMSH